MSGFSADWLALRAAVDARARDSGLARRLGAHFEGRSSIRVLDLGAGTGANLRATAPLMPVAQNWVLADNDATLLERARPPVGTTIERREIDLAGDLVPLFDPSPDLVTASAFLDLCGAAWLDRLADAVVRHRAAAYAVLSYDGRESWSTPHPLDAAALAAFHADQHRDKGLGPALGPKAQAHLADRLRRHGYREHEEPSDWRLHRPADTALIAALAEGSAAAIAPALGAEQAADWCRARTGATEVVIGHQDLLALPTG